MDKVVSNNKYRMCTRCVMDTTDPDITFDENGYCNHCKKYESRLQKWPQKIERQERLNELISKIKNSGKNNKYDCVIGVSGGVDSTYMAYIVKNYGLRPLAVHMDNGWNTELAATNISNFLSKLEIDLDSVALDWDVFKDLQLSFLHASTPDSEIPTDHAIWATLYKTAARNNIRFIIPAINWVTELILPAAWTYGVLDWQYIKSVQEKYGTKQLNNFPHLSFFDQFIYYRYFKKIQTVNLFNFIEFNKKEVTSLLEKELNWQHYGQKHYESIYTRFFQGYILPQKFNIDKRKAHFSSLIMAGQMTRAEALSELEKDIYSGYNLADDKKLVLTKLGVSENEFESIMNLPTRNHKEYRTFENYPKWWFSAANFPDYLLKGSFISGLYGLLPESIKRIYRQIKLRVKTLGIINSII